MAAELLPESAALSLENYVISRGAIVGYSDQEDLYPASNLTLHDRTQRWWNKDSTVDAWVISDFGEAMLPEMFAFADSDLNAGETVTLEGSDNIAFDGAGNVLTWTFTTWGQSLIGRLLRWHMREPDSGVAATNWAEVSCRHPSGEPRPQVRRGRAPSPSRQRAIGTATFPGDVHASPTSRLGTSRQRGPALRTLRPAGAERTSLRARCWKRERRLAAERPPPPQQR